MGKCLSMALMTAIVLSAVGRTTRAEVIAIVPLVTGTVQHLPELGILADAGVGSMIQSSYFKTTNLNREFRRGFVEFSVPLITDEILSARLVLPESRGWTSFPLPPDVHSISYYPADLVIDTDDFDRTTVFLARIETDVNLPTQTFSLDVSDLVKVFAGSNLGFKIQLDNDPTRADFGTSGTGFSEPFATSPTRLEVTIVPEPPAWHLISIGIAALPGLRSVLAGRKRLRVCAQPTRNG